MAVILYTVAYLAIHNNNVASYQELAHSLGSRLDSLVASMSAKDAVNTMWALCGTHRTWRCVPSPAHIAECFQRTGWPREISHGLISCERAAHPWSTSTTHR